MLSFLYLIVRAFARLLVTAGRHDGSKDLEILVLRPWGSKTRIPSWDCLYDAPMLLLLYLVLRALACLVVTGGQRGRDDGSKDLEILVLRHQLRVLQRTSGPPRFRVRDRILLAAASRLIPRDRWVAFLVTPATVLRGIASW